jgi:hypothetical protein
LNWAAALDERLKKEWVPDGTDQAPGWDWPTRLRGETEADIVRGMRFIRNRIHHQWADAVTVVEARHYYPPRESEWIWVPAGDLPKVERADDRGRDGYERMVEGHPADSTTQPPPTSCAFSTASSIRAGIGRGRDRPSTRRQA